MATIPGDRLMTAEEFMATDHGEGIHELIRGKVVTSPYGFIVHGYVCAQVAGHLHGFVRATNLGYCLCNNVAVLIQRDPDTVRCPDICYYSETRFPRPKVGPWIMPIPPDVAIEVVSPTDRWSEIERKIGEYLQAGSFAVWVISTENRTVMIHRDSDSPPEVLNDDVIADQPELPGFRCTVAELFP